MCPSGFRDMLIRHVVCRLTADATTAILKHRIAGDLHVQIPKQPGTPLASALPPDKDALPEELGVSTGKECVLTILLLASTPARQHALATSTMTGHQNCFRVPDITHEEHRNSMTPIEMGSNYCLTYNAWLERSRQLAKYCAVRVHSLPRSLKITLPHLWRQHTHRNGFGS